MGTVQAQPNAARTGAPAGLSLRVAALILAALLVLGGLGRLRTFDEPLERDITTYAVIAHEMLGGRLLYSDLWDHKPPAVHVTFAAAELVAGYGPQEVYLLNVVALWLAMVGAFLAGRTLGGPGKDAGAGLWAASAYLILSFSPDLRANQPNTEAFINVCTIWAMWLILRQARLGSPMKLAVALGVGVLTGVASLYKMVSVAPIGGMLLVWSVQGLRARPRQWRPLGLSCVMGGVTAAMWGAVLLYFHRPGRWEDFYDTVFVYNRAYAGNPLANLVMIVERYNLPFWAVLALVLGLGGQRAQGARGAPGVPGVPGFRGLAIGLAVGTAIAVALPGYLYPHYAQLWFPVMAILAAWLATPRAGATPGEHGDPAWRHHALLAALLLPLAIDQVYLLTMRTPDQWSKRKYGDEFVQSVEVAHTLHDLLKEGEVYYHIGDLTELYFYGKLSPASGVLYYYPLKGPDFPYPAAPTSPEPIRRRLLRRVMADLQKHPPDLMTISADDFGQAVYNPTLRKHPLIDLLLSHYVAITMNVGSPPVVIAMARRGSDLERRLSVKGAAPAASPPP